MRRDRTQRERDRFGAISAYVHSTHVVLAAATLGLPAASFITDPHSPAVITVTMLTAVVVSAGASLLVSAEFAPHHSLAAWLRRPGARSWTQVGVLAAVLALSVLVPPSGPPVLAEALPLAWALLAVAGGSFWSGLIRLLATSFTMGLATYVIYTLTGVPWEPLTVIVAALLTLGVLGQDSIYTLAIELDDLRTREAERAIVTERKRFAGDLHDIQGQHLGLITVEAELVSRLIDRGDYESAARHSERVQAITLEALDEMHRVVHANRQVRLDEEIANAVRVLRAAGVEVDRDTIDGSALDDETDRLLGLTVREGITNILKHTRAKTCSIVTSLESHARREGVALEVIDSGPGDDTGSDSPGDPSGTGLRTLADRYRRFGGALEFSATGGGRLSGWLPLPEQHTDGEI